MNRYQWRVIIATLLLTACSSNDSAMTERPVVAASTNETAVWLNSGSPAEVNCTLAGGTMALSRQLNGNRIGTCQLANGKRCDEASLMNGRCPAG